MEENVLKVTPEGPPKAPEIRKNMLWTASKNIVFFNLFQMALNRCRFFAQELFLLTVNPWDELAIQWIAVQLSQREARMFLHFN